MGNMCQQRQYKQIQSQNYQSKKLKNNFDFKFDQPKSTINLQNNKKPTYDTLQDYFQKQKKKKIQQSKKLEDYFQNQRKKKQEQNKNLSAYFNKMNKPKQLQPNQTQMAKVLYTYMRHYGHYLDNQILSFIQQNYNPSYYSQVFKLNQSSPTRTYKYQIKDRLKTANENRMISDHQVFKKANQQSHQIQYTWTVRHQLTNHRTLYDCVMKFDEKNRFLKLIMKQTDMYNYRAPPKQPEKEKESKNIWDTKRNNNYPGTPSTDWGAYYNAQTQRSNEQFRNNMNRQAQEWNNYARQQNTRGY